MKKMFALLFVLLSGCLIQAQDPMLEVAKKFVLLDNSADPAVATLLADDFRDEGNEADKAAFMKRIAAVRKKVMTGLACVKIADDKKCLTTYYNGNAKRLKAIQKYSAARLKKAAARLRNQYKHYYSDLKMSNASIKVVKVDKSKKYPIVHISMNDYAKGKVESKLIEKLELKKVNNSWRVSKLMETELDL